MKRVSQVSKRYAKALFEAVSNKEAALNELRVVARIISADATTVDFLSSQVQSDTLKKNIVKAAFEGKGVSQETLSFLEMLAENGRIHHLEDVLVSYEALVDAQNGLIRGTVKSAVKLDQDARLRIESVVSHFVKKKVILTYTEDSNLVGGVVAQVGGWTFEDTLDSHLRRLKEDLNRRAN